MICRALGSTNYDSHIANLGGFIGLRGFEKLVRSLMF